MNHLRVEGLRKAYGDNIVLRDIGFTAERGECVSIIGPSGSGKSTILRCLNRLETPDGGTIQVGEEPLSLDPTLPWRRRRADLIRQRRLFGMVFQQFDLFPNKSVLENVALGLTIVKRTDRRAAEARARIELERVGLGDKIDAMPASLSGGQQQRVGIARAVAMDPEILLFDEPTSALDPELVGEVLSVMRDIAASRTTMVVVTHELAFAREVADTVLFVEGGVVVEAGPPDQVIDAPENARTRRFLSRMAHG